MKSEEKLNEKYQFGDKLGEGAFGQVYCAINRESNQEVAIKIIVIEKDVDYLKRLLREILLLKNLKNENLILLKDIHMTFDNDNDRFKIYFVMDRMAFDLREMINLTNPFFNYHNKKVFMYEIFSGLAYLHHNKIVHRDLKPSNILIDKKDNDIKIADFGWARKIDSEDDKLTKQISNIHYKSPEICMRNQSLNWQVDIWAVGCIFFEIFEGKVLFEATGETDLLRKIIGRFGTPTPEEMSFIQNQIDVNLINNLDHHEQIKPSNYLKNSKMEFWGKYLLDECLKFNPNDRISALDALRHPYFSKIHDDEDFQNKLINHASQIDFTFESNPNINIWDLLKIIVKEIP